MAKRSSLGEWLPDNVTFHEKALSDFLSLDRSMQIPVAKAIKRVAENPKPISEGGYGKPLGNRYASDLTTLLKVKLVKQGIRIVYRLIREGDRMYIIVIGVRSDEEVYKEAARRLE